MNKPMDTPFEGDVKVPGVAQQRSFGAQADGDRVKLHFGNVVIRMEYNDALRLSQWIRMAAKQAKINAGDTSRIVRVLGAIDDRNRG